MLCGCFKPGGLYPGGSCTGVGILVLPDDGGGGAPIGCLFTGDVGAFAADLAVPDILGFAILISAHSAAHATAHSATHHWRGHHLLGRLRG
jgi:hypothetical protein